MSNAKAKKVSDFFAAAGDPDEQFVVWQPSNKKGYGQMTTITPNMVHLKKKDGTYDEELSWEMLLWKYQNGWDSRMMLKCKEGMIPIESKRLRRQMAEFTNKSISLRVFRSGDKDGFNTLYKVEVVEELKLSDGVPK